VGEWEVDPAFNPDEVYWNIWFHEDGRLFGTWRCDDDDEKPGFLNWFEKKMNGGEVIWFSTVQARTEEDAIKVGAEQLAMNWAQLAGMG
jgi:hypothetical protein